MGGHGQVKTARGVVPADAGIHTLCGMLFEGLWVIIPVSSPTPMVLGPCFRRDDRLYQIVTPRAFHSRNAWASRGETSGYSRSSPTLGRIFQERAHLLPASFSTTTATFGTSLKRNASAGACSLVTIALEVMHTSARSMSNSVSKIA